MCSLSLEYRNIVLTTPAASYFMSAICLNQTTFLAVRSITIKCQPVHLKPATPTLTLTKPHYWATLNWQLLHLKAAIPLLCRTIHGYFLHFQCSCISELVWLLESSSVSVSPSSSCCTKEGMNVFLDIHWYVQILHSYQTWLYELNKI